MEEKKESLRDTLERQIFVAYAVQKPVAEIAELEKKLAALGPETPPAATKTSTPPPDKKRVPTPPPVPIRPDLRHIRLSALPPDMLASYHALMNARTKYRAANDAVAVAEIEATLLGSCVNGYDRHQLRNGIEPDFSRPFVNDPKKNFYV